MTHARGLLSTIDAHDGGRVAARPKFSNGATATALGSTTL